MMKNGGSDEKWWKWQQRNKLEDKINFRVDTKHTPSSNTKFIRQP